MAWNCTANEGYEKLILNFSRKILDLGVDGRTVLKKNLRRGDLREWVEFNRLSRLLWTLYLCLWFNKRLGILISYATISFSRKILHEITELFFNDTLTTGQQPKVDRSV
jgi:hypothetical protein